MDCAFGIYPYTHSYLQDIIKIIYLITNKILVVHNFFFMQEQHLYVVTIPRKNYFSYHGKSGSERGADAKSV